MDEPLIPKEESSPKTSASQPSKSILAILLLLLVLIIAGISWYILAAGKAIPNTDDTVSSVTPSTAETDTADSSPATSPSPEVEIQSEVELQSSLNELDQADFNQFDTTLKQNDSEAAEL